MSVDSLIIGIPALAFLVWVARAVVLSGKRGTPTPRRLSQHDDAHRTWDRDRYDGPGPTQ
jgi:hypothetical protein